MADSPETEGVVTRARVRMLALRLSLMTTLVLLAVLATLDEGLHSPHAQHGIVSLELAGAGAARILGEWSEAQRRDALLLQGLDYLFIPAYAVLLATVALTLAAALRGRAQRLSRFASMAAWAAAGAGAADVIENIPLIAMLRAGEASLTGATVATAFATIKFGLLALVVLYLFCSVLARLIRAR